MKRSGWWWLALGLGAMTVGCATQQFIQEDPANHRRNVSTSAYSLEGCQEKMDELAGGAVQMTGHSQAILQSILNFGVTPFYRCSGTIADPNPSPYGHDSRHVRIAIGIGRFEEGLSAEPFWCQPGFR